MKNNLSLTLVALLPVALCVATGCASSNLNPNITVYDRDTVADRPISLPGNYNTDNFRKLRLAVVANPVKTSSRSISAETANYMNLRMQSEMTKIKRFSIYALHGADTSQLQELADLGELNLIEPADLPTVDYQLSWTITLNAKSEPDGRDNTITFVCNINMQLIDIAKREPVMSKDLDIRVKREQRVDRYGHVVEGFSYTKANMRALLQDISTQAAIRIANELGNELPVGGRITGALGTDMMTLDKGTEQGIAKGMQMVVFANVGGVDVPIANAEATPSSNTSQLEVWRLNTKNKYAAKVLKDMEADSGWLNKNKLYAVGYGMAMPPEWQTKEMYLPE